MTEYYLKKNIAIEPLIARYRSSPYLISPCSAPRFLRYLVKKLLSSFIKSPRYHELALKNVAMQGGMFVELPSEQKEKAENLLNFQIKNLNNLFEVANSQDELWERLKLASGEPLDDFIKDIPLALSGLVELFYSRLQQATYRMNEGLLYHSEVYQESLQEIILFPMESDMRSFVLTTPRLESNYACFLKIPHCSSALDDLSKARTHSLSDLKSLAHSLTVNFQDIDLFYSFFEPASTSSPYRFKKDVYSEFQTRYFGHACVEVSNKTTTILIDPLISYDVPGSDDQRLTYLDLPERLDAIVITHLHLDHFCIETLIQLRHKVKAVVIAKSNGGSPIDPSSKWILYAIGFDNIIELDTTESYQCGDITITALPFHGEHGCFDITSKAIFHIKSSSTSLIFAADMRAPDKALLKRVAKIVGKVDTLFLGLEAEGAPASWLYGSLLDEKINRQWDQKRRLNGSDAQLGWEIITEFNPTKVRIYALGREPWLSNLMRVDMNPDSIVQKEINVLTEKCRKFNIDISTLYLNSIEKY